MLTTQNHTASEPETSEIYLVVCTHPGYPAHAWLINAGSEELARRIGRYRYQNETGAEHSEEITTRITRYADLPGVMFGQDD